MELWDFICMIDLNSKKQMWLCHVATYYKSDPKWIYNLGLDRPVPKKKSHYMCEK